MVFMRKVTFPLLAVSLVSALSLPACSGAKEKLGLTREAPDEFAVIRRAPLEVPPELAALPVPRPGAPRPQEKTAQEMAAEAVFGPELPEMVEGEDEGEIQQTIVTKSSPINNPAPVTAADQALIEAAGATETPDNIRQVVDEENEDTAYEEQAVIDKIFDRKREAKGSVLDPNEEAARLEEQLPQSTRVIQPGTVSEAE